MSSAAPASGRRNVLEYAFGFDLVIIAIGLGLLLPPEPGLVLVPFIAAVGVSTFRGGWKVGLATTAFSIAGLLTTFADSVPPTQLLLFAVIGVAASTLLDLKPVAKPGDEAALDRAAEEERQVRARVAELSDAVRRRALPALMYVALPVLVVVVYLNLSSILVEKFSIPSVLQPLVLVLSGLVVQYRHSFRFDATLALPITAGLIAYCLIAFASSTWARDIYVSDSELKDLVKGVLLMLVAASLAASWRALRGAMTALVCSAALVAAMTLVQVAIGNPDLQFGGLAGVEEGHIFGEVSELRPTGPLSDPNYFARILILAFPPAALLGVGRRSRAERAAYVAAAAVIALGILATYSRGGMLTLAFACLLLVLAGRLRINRITVMVALASLVALAPTPVGQRFLTIESLVSSDAGPPDASSAKRQQLIAVGWRIFTDHPIAGVGIGNFGSHYQAYADVVGMSAPEYTPLGVRQYPHSLYLELAVETGLVGLLVFAGAMLLIFTTLYRARAALLARGESGHAAMVVAIAIAVAGYLLASVFLHHTGVQRYFWLVVGFAIAAARLVQEETAEAAPVYAAAPA